MTPLGSDTFTVTLPADQTNVAFSLLDLTTDNGQSDIAGGANLQLTALLPNPIAGGAPLQSTPLSIEYLAQTPDTSNTPQPDDVITRHLRSEHLDHRLSRRRRQ